MKNNRFAIFLLIGLLVVAVLLALFGPRHFTEKKRDGPA